MAFSDVVEYQPFSMEDRSALDSYKIANFPALKGNFRHPAGKVLCFEINLVYKIEDLSVKASLLPVSKDEFSFPH